MLFLLLAVVLLVTPPALISILPPPWLALFAPACALGFYGLLNFVTADFAVNDPGPAGLFVLGYFGVVFWVNVIALLVRVLRSL